MVSFCALDTLFPCRAGEVLLVMLGGVGHSGRGCAFREIWILHFEALGVFGEVFANSNFRSI